MANSIKVYRSSDQGAPNLTGSVGSLVSLLRQCLVTGYSGANFQINSITRSGTTATATIASTGTLFTGMSVTISGASDALYNGTFTITVASSTTFTYTMGGTPAASPAVGTLVMAPSFGISSITRSGTTVTVTLSQANSTLLTNDWVTIAGAVETDYNGEHQITATSGTTFTYQIATTPSSPATGTLTYYKSPAGWTEAFTGTNKSAFRGGATNNSAQFYLRVDDGNTVVTTGGAKQALVRGYVAMTDVDTGTEPFPTVAQMTNGGYWLKSSTADQTNARAWIIVADDRFFYINIYTAGAVYTASTNATTFGFGWFPSYKSGDAYNCLISGGVQDGNIGSGSTPQGLIGQGSSLAAAGGSYLPRSYPQSGASVGWCAFASSTVANPICACLSSMVNVGYPNGADQAMLFNPVQVVENGFRGAMPGAYSHFHNSFPFNPNDTITGVAQLPGVTMLCLWCNSGGVQGAINVDITGPWA